MNHKEFNSIIKNMSYSDLNTKLKELNDKIIKLKFRNSTSGLSNPLEIRELRRNIARVNTVILKNRKIL
ncbi:MAG: 50S ribosomal protein L29 [Endomicrobium sp.]|nr:50S ribosomal protein L29 [Endomicrobium sp.]